MTGKVKNTTKYNNMCCCLCEWQESVFQID